ncbi:MAG: hypothetical protein FJ288_01500 [Planctomycetes bacterium]|nr:hypothetical protein [Planctomycetota bacterium]
MKRNLACVVAVIAGAALAAAAPAGGPGGDLRAAESAAGAGPPPPARSRLGINLAGPADWNTEYPFVDVFRLSRKWISQRKGQPWGKGPELICDARGWVKKLDADCWAETPLCTGGHAPSGQYVCLYEGDGAIEFKGRGPARVVSQEAGRMVVEIDGAQGFFLLLRRTNPDNYVRNIRVIMPGFEKTYAKDPFHPDFLGRWRGFNTLRFMDWMETNGSQVSRWEDRPVPEDATFCARGVPVEVMVDLANRLKANPWFCMPHLATDDYVRNFARVVKERLDPSLRAHVEYSNEVWNSMFAQTKYAGEEGVKLGFAEKPWEAGWRYSAYRSVQMFKIWEEVFGGRNRLVRVIASQCAANVSEEKLRFQDAAKQCDALAIAPYISFIISTKAGKDKPDAGAVAGWTLDQLLDHVEKNCLPRSIRNMEEQKKIADRYGLRLMAYEAGQHLVGAGGGENEGAMTKLFQAANRHPRMGEFYTRYLDGWKAAGGDLMCIFSSVGRWSKWGSWGLLEYADETEKDQPKFRAVMEWNRRNPR